MSEAETLIIPTRANAQGLARFLEGVGVKKTCECCAAHDQWHIEAGLRMHSSVKLATAESIPVVNIMCKNCGHIRQLSAVVILQWLKRHPE